MDPLIVNIAIWMLVIEASLVILFVVCNYIVRLYQYFLLRDKKNISEHIENLFMFYIKTKSNISSKDMDYFNKKILRVLKVMETFKVSSEESVGWGNLRNQLVMKLFYPKGKLLYNSWRAYKRYYAARCFIAHFEESDAEMVIKLIRDPVLLVSLNAARVAFKYHSRILINASIDVFSTYRKIRQSIYSSIAHLHSEEVERIVIDRLSIEKDPYVKAFCYRLLQQLPVTESIDDLVKLDLTSNVLDLQMSVLHYCKFNPNYYHFLGKYIDDEKWQLRAAAAELIGNVKYIPATSILEKRLSDHEWWVRIRTAEALGKLGEAGIAVLKAQTPERDRYAYDAAQQVLDAIMSGESP